jgi:hypothetical protein
MNTPSAFKMQQTFRQAVKAIWSWPIIAEVIMVKKFPVMLNGRMLKTHGSDLIWKPYASSCFRILVVIEFYLDHEAWESLFQLQTFAFHLPPAQVASKWPKIPAITRCPPPYMWQIFISWTKGVIRTLWHTYDDWEWYVRIQVHNKWSFKEMCFLHRVIQTKPW